MWSYIMILYASTVTQESCVWAQGVCDYRDYLTPAIISNNTDTDTDTHDSVDSAVVMLGSLQVFIRFIC